MTTNQIIQNLRDSGFIIPVLTTYTLLPEGTMNAEQEAVYNLVYNSKNTEELQQIHITADLSEYAVDGAVASGDFDKFKFVLGHFPFKHNYANHVINDVIYTAARAKVNEDDAMKMVEFLVEYQAPRDKYVIGSAADKSYYKIAEYLLKHEGVMKSLNRFDFYELDNETKLFDSFKWQSAHGAKIEPGLVSKIICDSYFEHNFEKHKSFNNEKNINEAVDFLIEINITDRDKVSEIKQNCNIISKLHSYTTLHREDFLIASIKKHDSINNIKFLIDNGALESKEIDFDDLNMIKHQQTRIAGKVCLELINYPNAELVHYIIDEMKAKDMEVREAGYEDYPKYIVSYITRDMDNCEGNKLIADYAGVTNSIDWSSCETDL
ncbi:MAG: hypothetical protein AABY27_07305 [Pseudomonadota bacterium]